MPEYRLYTLSDGTRIKPPEKDAVHDDFARAMERAQNLLQGDKPSEGPRLVIVSKHKE